MNENKHGHRELSHPNLESQIWAVCGDEKPLTANRSLPFAVSVKPRHQRTGRGAGGAAASLSEKSGIVRAKLMYRSGKDSVKNILLVNILIYLFSSRIWPNRLTDLCTTSRDGCYYSELEH